MKLCVFGTNISKSKLLVHFTKFPTHIHTPNNDTKFPTHTHTHPIMIQNSPPTHTPPIMITADNMWHFQCVVYYEAS